MRSTVHSRSPPPVARNCAVPLEDSQKRNRFGWFVSCLFSRGTSFGKTRTFFKMSLPSACPGPHAAKLWDLPTACNFALPNGMSTASVARSTYCHPAEPIASASRHSRFESDGHSQTRHLAVAGALPNHNLFKWLKMRKLSGPADAALPVS